MTDAADPAPPMELEALLAPLARFQPTPSDDLTQFKTYLRILNDLLPNEACGITLQYAPQDILAGEVIVAALPLDAACTGRDRFRVSVMAYQVLEKSRDVFGNNLLLDYAKRKMAVSLDLTQLESLLSFIQEHEAGKEIRRTDMYRKVVELGTELLEKFGKSWGEVKVKVFEGEDGSDGNYFGGFAGDAFRIILDERREPVLERILEAVQAGVKLYDLTGTEVFDDWRAGLEYVIQRRNVRKEGGEVFAQPVHYQQAKLTSHDAVRAVPPPVLGMIVEVFGDDSGEWISGSLEKCQNLVEVMRMDDFRAYWEALRLGRNVSEDLDTFVSLMHMHKEGTRLPSPRAIMHVKGTGWSSAKHAEEGFRPGVHAPVDPLLGYDSLLGFALDIDIEDTDIFSLKAATPEEFISVRDDYLRKRQEYLAAYPKAIFNPEVYECLKQYTGDLRFFAQSQAIRRWGEVEKKRDMERLEGLSKAMSYEDFAALPFDQGISERSDVVAGLVSKGYSLGEIKIIVKNKDVATLADACERNDVFLLEYLTKLNEGMSEVKRYVDVVGDGRFSPKLVPIFIRHEMQPSGLKAFLATVGTKPYAAPETPINFDVPRFINDYNLLMNRQK